MWIQPLYPLWKQKTEHSTTERRSKGLHGNSQHPNPPNVARRHSHWITWLPFLWPNAYIPKSLQSVSVLKSVLSTSSSKNLLLSLLANPFSPLQAFKNARNPKFVQNLAQRLFWGFQSGGLRFGKICQNLSENYRFSNFDRNFSKFQSPDWNPPKQSLGQILDKFGVSGVFEGCEGEKGSQVSPMKKGFCFKLPFATWNVATVPP